MPTKSTVDLIALYCTEMELDKKHFEIAKQIFVDHHETARQVSLATTVRKRPAMLANLVQLKQQYHAQKGLGKLMPSDMSKLFVPSKPNPFRPLHQKEQPRYQFKEVNLDKKC